MTKKSDKKKNRAKKDVKIETETLKSNERPHLWAITSDLHVNSTVGLCPGNGVELDDGGVYMPSNTQLALWDRWLDFWDQIRKFKTTFGADLKVSLVGDVVDGDHHNTSQIISRNMTTQMFAALEVLKPMMDLEPDSVYMFRGTSAHVGKSAQHEEAIAKQIGTVPDPVTGAWTRWHSRITSHGKILDFAHHGRMGFRPWTKLGALGNYAVQTMVDCIEEGIPIPNFMFRGHLHQMLDTGENNHKTRAIALPSWQFATEFTHRIAAGVLPSFGGYALLINPDGSSMAHPLKYKVKRNADEEVK